MDGGFDPVRLLYFAAEPQGNSGIRDAALFGDVAGTPTRAFEALPDFKPGGLFYGFWT